MIKQVESNKVSYYVYKYIMDQVEDEQTDHPQIIGILSTLGTYSHINGYKKYINMKILNINLEYLKQLHVKQCKILFVAKCIQYSQPNIRLSEPIKFPQ